MVVSFDFDGTLSVSNFEIGDSIVNLARKLVATPGFEVIVLTSRDESKLDAHFWSVVNALGIKKVVAIGQTRLNKVDFIVEHSIDLHFDDDVNEIWQINTRYFGRGVLVNMQFPMHETFDL